LGPRLFAAFIYGWNNVFCAHNYYFWVPIIGPILGAIIGVWIYEFYGSIINKYGPLSNSEKKDFVQLGHEPTQTEDVASELRQQLTTVPD
jgi:hypothetical protein